MALFRKTRARWRMARGLAQAEADGQVLITVPAWLAADVSSYVWRQKVEHAADRWAANVDDKSLLHWEGEIPVSGRHRRGKPRES